MIKTFIKKWLIVFSIILSALSIIYACGGDYEPPEVSSFSPAVFENFYTPDLYWDYVLDESEYRGRFNGDITTDWKGFLKEAIKIDDLAYLLLVADQAEIDSINLFYQSNSHNRVSEKWKGKIDLNDSKIKGFIEFMHWAKYVEPYSIIAGDEWTYGVKGPIIDKVQLIDQLKERYASVKDPFLKNRYWFQVIKACFYSTQRQDAIDFFEATKSANPQNLLYYRALSYVAGLISINGENAKSNYYYSIIFDNCEALQIDASFGFHPQEEVDWNASLELAKNPKEKAALWALFGYYADEYTAIEKIFEILPESRHLDNLLNSLIHKEELRLHDEIEYTDYRKMPIKTIEDYKEAFSELQNESIHELIDKIAKSDKVKSPHLWYLASGYLKIFAGKHQEAEQLFSKIEKTVTINENAKKQLRLMRLINKLSEMTTISSVQEELLYTDLNWLYNECEKADTTYEKIFQYRAASDWSKRYLAFLYESRKDGIMREMFHRTDEIYLLEDDILRMRNFMLRTDKTDFEKLAMNLYSVNVNQLDEFRMIKHALADNEGAAIKLLETLPESFDYQFEADPFLGKIKDCHDCDFMDEKKQNYTRLSFLKHVKALKEKLNRKENQFANALKLGNAFYSISFYGNSRIFFAGEITQAYYYDASYIPEQFKNILLDMSVAKKYYTMALNTAITNEQKAECWYMLSKCERNEYYNTKFYYTRESDNLDSDTDLSSENKDFIAWEGFKVLSEKYSKTKYYKEVINECGYFNTFMKAKRIKK